MTAQCISAVLTSLLEFHPDLYIQWHLDFFILEHPTSIWNLMGPVPALPLLPPQIALLPIFPVELMASSHALCSRWTQLFFGTVPSPVCPIPNPSPSSASRNLQSILTPCTSLSAMPTTTIVQGIVTLLTDLAPSVSFPMSSLPLFRDQTTF